jgi:hypothetical protein
MQLWSDVVGSPPATVDDDFFRCGGHSLQAARLLLAVRETWNVALAVRAFFEEPTIATLARLIAAAPAGPDAPAAVRPAARERHRVSRASLEAAGPAAAEPVP